MRWDLCETNESRKEGGKDVVASPRRLRGEGGLVLGTSER